ncbi:MAG TPA: hypothetical protein VGT79_10295 [Xanthomonadaceae bacterium]|nr:hypothetical protein [Xanthomonadaceae bacterium]
MESAMSDTSSRRVIAKLYERDIDLVLIEELQSSAEFRRWLAARVYGTDCYMDKYQSFHSWTDETKRESDVVYIFRANESALNAILIENKIDAIAQPNQGIDYRKRGEAGIGKEWAAYKTCLVAPKAYLEHAHDKVNYDECVTYEELLAYFASRKDRDERFRWKAQLIEAAIIKKQSTYSAAISEPTTEFVKAYYEIAKNHPDLQMYPPKPRPIGSTWVSFKPPLFPKGVILEHQVTAGAVKIYIQNSAERFEEIRASLAGFVTDEMSVEIAGKSVAVSIKVPAIESMTVPFESVREQAIEGIRAADSLVDLARRAKVAGVRFT